MRQTTHLTGDPVGSGGLASSIPTFGWQRLHAQPSVRDPEELVGISLIRDFGVYVSRAGSRAVSYDLEVLGRTLGRPHRSDPLRIGRYEVKSLWRRDAHSSFDPRFKVGTRGETIYGRRDSAIKAFAVQIEDRLDEIVSVHIDETARTPCAAQTHENMRFVENAHRFIDDALARRHSKDFSARLDVMLRIAEHVGIVRGVTIPHILDEDIRRGFDGIEGIFIVAGPMYTLVTKDEMGDLLAFDSASSEGPKLRLVTEIPCDRTKRKQKGKTKR